MIQLKGTQSSLEHTQQLFKDNKRAFYSRFDNADTDMILGRNASDCTISPVLSKEMTEAFQINHPHYLRVLAINRVHSNISSRKILELLTVKAGSLEGVMLENPVFQRYMGVFQPESIDEVLEDLIHTKRIMFIGYLPKERVEQLFGSVAYHIETPASNAYASINTWWPEAIKHIHEVEKVVLAAADATCVVNKRLWETGSEIQSFDMRFLTDIIHERESRIWIDEPETEHSIADVFNDDDTSEELVYPEKENKLVSI